ncbi:elongation factor G [Lignipirellula cremea]|uniref:Elongation factor G n=1 Tax=Lignipirellula cremea TaxID=2528010 RepID=A0A518E3L2_9BACT|nr:elongation factor G [Lignipirellula cremea]QDU98686.1 Elongation factor G [Lignipirellula cremea]
MTKRTLETLRNIGVIAHIDAGKTTVTERMLYLSGASHKVGQVDKGTTITDDDPEEADRGITIYSACVTFDWNKSHVNLLDTPGHVDFTAEVERCLRVLDGAVVVFSAREGVEAQSETVWRQANKYGVPRIAFINKLDREGAGFERVFNELNRRLGATPVAISIPYGQGPEHVENPFRGIIDLIEMKLLTFDKESLGKQFEVSEIPEEMLDEAQVWRETMIEKLYEYSNEMMELALQEEPIPIPLIRKVLREATLAMQIQPLLCGSALHGIGVQTVLNAVEHYLPSPLDRPAVKGFNPFQKDKKTGEPAIEERGPNNEDPFCALVFKIIPERTADNYWVRVYSGELKQNSRVSNPGKELKENVSQLWQLRASKKNPQGQIEKVGAGDIVCLIGPRHSITGDTLCDPKHPIVLEAIEFPKTVISMAIEPENTAERKKLGEMLEMLKRQDPTFQAVENEETGQTLISGMGELHLDIIKNRLLRDFKLNVKVHKPRVSYRETVSKATETVGECHRIVGGAQLFAKVKLRIEPNTESDKPVTLINACPPESLSADLVTAVMEQLKAKGEGGGLSSFPLSKLKVTFLGGETREEGSNEMAFSIAASEAFEHALRAAGPVLLEPVMKLQITTPEDYYGDFVNDIQKRRGMISETEQRGEVTVIEAHVPLVELFGYSDSMRSLSQGRGGASMQPHEYQPAPPEVGREYGITS